jgi:hypothetical protein
LALATVLGQIGEQGVHALKFGAVNQLPATRLAADQARVVQGFEVERQGAGRNAQRGGQGAGRQAFCPCHHQGAKGPQALALGQGGQSVDNLWFRGVLMFHVSIILEILKQYLQWFVTVSSQWIFKVQSVLNQLKEIS